MAEAPATAPAAPAQLIVAANPSRREDILMAALRLIGSRGCDGLSHRKIAEEAKVPLGSTTYYFRSRDELLLEAFRLYMRQFDARLQRSLDSSVKASKQADPAQRVADFLVELVRDELTEPALLRAEIELIAYSVDHLELSIEFAAWEHSMASPLREHLQQQGFDQPAQLAGALMRLTRGFEIQALIRPQTDFGEYRAQLLRILSAYRGHRHV